MANVRFTVYSCLLLLQTVLLFACSTTYRAPVMDISGGPRYVTDGRMHRVNEGETLYVVAWLYDLDYQLLAQVNDLRPPYTLQIGQLLRVDLRGETLRPTVTTTAAVTHPAITSSPVPVTRLPIPETPEQTAEPVQNAPPSAESAPREATASAESPAGTAEEVGAPLPATIPSTATPPIISTGPDMAEPSPTVASNLPPQKPEQDNSDTAPAWIWPAQGELVGHFSTSGTENKGIDISGQPGDPVLASAAGEVVYAGGGLLHYGEMIIIKHDSRHLSAYAHNSRLLVNEGEQVGQGQKIAELGSTGIDRNILHFEIREEGRPVDPLRFLPAR